jgi:hypothetical protein
MRSFSLVLLRRLLFRPAPSTNPQPPNPSHPSPRLTLYDHLSSQTLTTLERLLLHSLSHEPAPMVRRKSVDTVCDLASQGMLRGRPWHALQAQAFSMTQVQGGAGESGVGAPALRESAYRVFAGCPNLVMDLQTDAVLGVFQRGLQDGYSVEVCLLLPLTLLRNLTSSYNRCGTQHSWPPSHTSHPQTRTNSPSPSRCSTPCSIPSPPSHKTSPQHPPPAAGPPRTTTTYRRSYQR